VGARWRQNLSTLEETVSCYTRNCPSSFQVDKFFTPHRPQNNWFGKLPTPTNNTENPDDSTRNDLRESVETVNQLMDRKRVSNGPERGRRGELKNRHLCHILPLYLQPQYQSDGQSSRIMNCRVSMLRKLLLSLVMSVCCKVHSPSRQEIVPYRYNVPVMMRSSSDP
jgi:hypothetical protein